MKRNEDYNFIIPDISNELALLLRQILEPYYAAAPLDGFDGSDSSISGVLGPVCLQA
jgi:hypothetical protein